MQIEGPFHAGIAAAAALLLLLLLLLLPLPLCCCVSFVTPSVPAARGGLQRSGVSRLKMLASNRNLRQTIIVEGMDAMARLLRCSDEEDVLTQVLEIVTKLASESADDEREVMCLDGTVEAAQALAENAKWSPELRALAAGAVAALQTRDGSVSEEPLI